MDGLTQTQRAETDEERIDRVRRENVIIAKAEANIAAGLVIDFDELDAWFDALDLDENAPPPAILRTK